MKALSREQIEAQGGMFGGDSNARLKQDSRELARQDGRAEARDADRERALHDLTDPGPVPAQEIPAGAEGLVSWDASPDQAGHLTPNIETEDEADISADQAREGRGEAEDELRRAANREPRGP